VGRFPFLGRQLHRVVNHAGHPRRLAAARVMIGLIGAHFETSVTAMIPILHRDDRVVVVAKPAGLLVHRSTLDRHETVFLVQSLRDQLGCVVHPVHRLDRPTSGAMVLALDARACTLLSESFEQGLVEKRYLAVVRGHMPAEGVVDHPLHRLRDDPGQRPVASVRVADEARTRYRCLAKAELPHRIDRYPTTRYSLVALAPLTGRRHQLRRHLKHLAHPIIGDTTYGKSLHNRYFEQHLGSNRLLLASTQLSFPHPEDGRRLAVGAPLSDDFRRVVISLGWVEPCCTQDALAAH